MKKVYLAAIPTHDMSKQKQHYSNAEITSNLVYRYYLPTY